MDDVCEVLNIKVWKYLIIELIAQIRDYVLVLALLQYLKLLPNSAAAIAANPAADMISAAETWDCCWESVEALEEEWFWWDWWAIKCYVVFDYLDFSLYFKITS